MEGFSDKRYVRSALLLPVTYEEAYSPHRKTSASIRCQRCVSASKRIEAFSGSLANIMQTFDGKELYPSLEEKAANLLYFLVKNHSFVDGNKRIAAALFLWFLEKNGALYSADGN